MTQFLTADRGLTRAGLWTRLWFAVTPTLMVGCGTGVIQAEKPVPLVASRLFVIGHAYNQFWADHGRPPKAAEELRGLIPEPEAWISPRDGKAFVLVFGFNPGAARSESIATPIVAHEATGSGGSRYVLTMMGNAAVWSEADFQAYRASVAGKQP
jgi:hypothetical protein